jgi:hypothetical protein
VDVAVSLAMAVLFLAVCMTIAGGSSGPDTG